MFFTNEDDFKRHVKARDFKRVYFIFGNENYLTSFYSNLLADKSVGKDFADFNLRKADGRQATLDDISDCTSVYPMMGEYTCTLVTDYPLNNLVGDKGKINPEFDDIIKNIRDKGK